MVNILPNYRSGNMFGGGEQEFREGDRAWPGAAIRRASRSLLLSTSRRGWTSPTAGG
jgi:hypothetical protein